MGTPIFAIFVQPQPLGPDSPLIANWQTPRTNSNVKGNGLALTEIMNIAIC